MKRVGISAVERPQVIIECAGHQEKSGIIQSAKINPNFQEQVVSFEMVSHIPKIISVSVI